MIRFPNRLGKATISMAGNLTCPASHFLALECCGVVRLRHPRGHWIWDQHGQAPAAVAIRHHQESAKHLTNWYFAAIDKTRFNLDEN